MAAPNRDDPTRFKQVLQGSTVSFELGINQPPARSVRVVFVHREDPIQTITALKDMGQLDDGEDQTRFRVTIEIPGDVAPGLYRWERVNVHTAAGEELEVGNVPRQLAPVWLEVLEEPREVLIGRGYWPQ